MLELADRLLARRAAGRRLAVATVVAVEGSSPGALGTSLALDDAGQVVGSIAGGCVEGAALALCEAVLAGGAPEGPEAFGVADEDALAAGLPCGGTLLVHARPLVGADLPALRAAAAGDPAWTVSRLGPVDPADRAALDAAVAARAATGVPGTVRVTCDGRTAEAFVEVRAPRPRLVLYGALELSAALAALAGPLGWHVTVCDPRPVLATAERLPGADAVVVDWPPRHLAAQALGPRDAVCVLAHDDRFETELLLRALRSGPGFVGAVGSRRTHARRVAALRAAGATAEEVARLHSPLGLDLGAATPAETALSVAAGLLAARTGATGLPLRDLDGPLHRRPADGSLSSPAPVPPPGPAATAGRP
ncbi:XdhC family protein [Cellulomonas endophytica]|uniref:XdhC family protein n=1 Tax=Cellulomonas endophytica TaxID=2494735 RepID=UPI0010133F2B|nr:XdhC/CoxI family protein [Cellulomonas endophytica]